MFDPGSPASDVEHGMPLLGLIKSDRQHTLLFDEHRANCIRHREDTAHRRLLRAYVSATVLVLRNETEAGTDVAGRLPQMGAVLSSELD